MAIVSGAETSSPGAEIRLMTASASSSLPLRTKNQGDSGASETRMIKGIGQAHWHAKGIYGRQC